MILRLRSLIKLNYISLPVSDRLNRQISYVEVMMRSKRSKTILMGSLVSSIALLTSQYSAAQVQDINYGASQLIQDLDSGNQALSTIDFSLFTPKPDGRKRKMDYSVLDAALDEVVIDLGPSTRIWQSRPVQDTGTRFLRGHKSPFRLEGKRFTFSFINDDYIEGLTLYRKDLESLASEYDITRFPKDEQLSFWFNLHNIAVLEQIALKYPVKKPEDIKILTPYGSKKLNEAKFINIKGQALSLRDIREKIVYKNWDDPDVIYGFFRGDIGSPSIQEYAFTPSRLDYMLESNATDFVNSLRGYRKSRSIGQVSKILKEDGSFFFKDWDRDVKSHLLKHANKTLRAEINELSSFKSASYEKTVADLAGGDWKRTKNLNVQSDQPFDFDQGNLSPEITRILRELRGKYQTLRQRGVIGPVLNGTVIITDIETDDEDDGAQTETP